MTLKLGRSKQAKLAKLMKELDVPMPDETNYLVVGKHIVFVHVDNDSDIGNPCEEEDGLGLIRSFGRKHINHIDPDEARAMMEADKDIVPLSYYEHGRSLWLVADSTAPAGVEFQWDGVRFAGIWIPDQCVRESYTGQDGKSRAEWMKEQAAACCSTYTDWSNGDVFAYTVQVHAARYSDDGDLFDDFDDYRFDDAEYDNSCAGFIGWEYFEQVVKSQIEAAITYALQN